MTASRDEPDATAGPETATDPDADPTSARSQSQGSPPGTVPVRTTGSVSLREIAKAENRNTTPVRVSDLAGARGIGAGERFALRELITSQSVNESRLKTISAGTRSWTNWLDDYETQNARPYEPTTPDDVRQIVLQSARDDRQVRAVGAGHSHSKAASPGKDYIDLYRYENGQAKGLVGAKPTRPHRSDRRNATHYAPPKGSHTTYSDLSIVRVGAGAMLKRLNRKVLKDKGLGLLNMGSFDEQTMAGAINTGTHGTGRNLGTLADSVLAVEMVTVMDSPARDEPIVRRFRIEPTAGITDRAGFENDVKDHGMALIQDDDIFHSAVVGYGAMGVATAYTLKVRTRYFLKETSKVKDWKTLRGDPSKRSGPNKGLLWEKLKDPNVRHVQFLLNIPSTFGGSPTDNPTCMLRWHELKPWKQKPSNYSGGLYTPDWPPPRTNKCGQDAARWIREVTTGAGVDPTTPNSLLAFLIRNFFNSQTNAFKAKGAKLTLATKQRDDTAWYVALRRTQDKYRDTPAKPPNDPDPAMTTEVAVPIDQVEEAVETVIETVRNVHDNQDLHFMAPLGVRFVAPSDHNLSAEFDGTYGDYSDGVAMLELPFSVGPVSKTRATQGLTLSLGAGSWLVLTIGQLANILPDKNISQQQMVKLSKAALEPVEQALINQHDGRPHMGKYNSLDGQKLANLYGDLSTWKTVNEQFNAVGTFNNRFTKKLGLNQ